MRYQTLIIEGELPSENEIIAAQVPKFRAGKRWVSNYSEWKKSKTQEIVLAIRAQRIVPVVHYPIIISFVFYTKDRRKNPDNILAGANKFILDALQAAGIIRNDGWKELVDCDGTTGAAPKFFCLSGEPNEIAFGIRGKPRIEVCITEPYMGNVFDGTYVECLA